jgi:hypothetical protein
MAVRTAQSIDADRAPLALNSRRDTWLIRPVITVIVLGLFVLYSLFRTFAFADYQYGPYLSPFYSPFLDLNFKFFNLPISPAIYILIFPLSFRLTCYYYRLAYYRAFFWDPPACAVPEPRPRRSYSGERYFPFVLQNIHRYAFYAAFIFIFILLYDAIKAFFWDDGFHIGVGTIVLCINVILLAAYTFSCHSFRHLIGGRVNCYSCTLAGKTRYGMWKQVSFLNNRHALLAWSSLVAVALTDVYIWLVASGAITDFRII